MVQGPCLSHHETKQPRVNPAVIRHSTHTHRDTGTGSLEKGACHPATPARIWERERRNLRIRTSLHPPKTTLKQKTEIARLRGGSRWRKYEACRSLTANSHQATATSSQQNHHKPHPLSLLSPLDTHDKTKGEKKERHPRLLFSAGNHSSFFIFYFFSILLPIAFTTELRRPGGLAWPTPDRAH